MKQLKLNITGEINTRLYDEILKTVTNQNDFEEVVLIINSTGGSVKIAMAIYDLLKSLNTNITTVALGKCYSSATILFALGEERYIGKNTGYLLHQTNYTLAKDTTLTSGDLREMVKASNDDEKRWKEILKENCTGAISEFLDKVFSSKDDVFLTSEQVLKFGLAIEQFINIKDILK